MHIRIFQTDVHRFHCLHHVGTITHTVFVLLLPAPLNMATRQVRERPQSSSVEVCRQHARIKVPHGREALSTAKTIAACGALSLVTTNAKTPAETIPAPGAPPDQRKEPNQNNPSPWDSQSSDNKHEDPRQNHPSPCGTESSANKSQPKPSQLQPIYT